MFENFYTIFFLQNRGKMKDKIKLTANKMKLKPSFKHKLLDYKDISLNFISVAKKMLSFIQIKLLFLLCIWCSCWLKYLTPNSTAALCKTNKM